MRRFDLERNDRRRGVRLALAAGIAAWLLGCGDDDPTGLGSGMRTPPDSLHVFDLRQVEIDSVYPVPVSLGRSGIGEVGDSLGYRAHVLYDFQIPTRVVQSADTLQLDDELVLTIRTDSLLLAPFVGTMRLGLQQVAPEGRSWAQESWIDSVITQLPPLDPVAIARDTLLDGAGLVNRAVQLRFPLRLQQIAGYDSVRLAGGTLEVNVALVCEELSPGGHGFLEYPYLDTAGNETAQLNGFSTQQATAIASVGPTRRRAVVTMDSSWSPGDKLVVSDGYRLHTYLRFAPIPSVLPELALVYSAELVLTQVDTLDGTSFGLGPELGLIVPRDTTVSIWSKQANVQLPSFRSPLAAVPRGTVTVVVTPYVFDQQEGRVPNRGVILALPSEGTRVRHFEFYGPAAPDSLRPLLRIVYGLPAPFEGGGR